MKTATVFIAVLIVLVFSSLGICLPLDPAVGNLVKQSNTSAGTPATGFAPVDSRDSVPPTFTVSHTENGDVTIQIVADENLYAGWAAEKLLWSRADFNYWWLNTRLARDSQNELYAAVKLYEYSNPTENFDMFHLYNNGDVEAVSEDWNGPGNNPLIIDALLGNSYIGQPTFDKEGAVDANGCTYVFHGGNTIYLNKLDADGVVVINNEPIITGADSWTNEIRTAIDTNDKVYIVWSSDMHDITYSCSDDGGYNWSDPVSLCYNAGYQLNKPQVCCDSNDNVHIIWQTWSGSSNLLSYMKLLPDGTISIDVSYLTQSNNQCWSPQLSIDEQDNVHIAWAKSSQQVTDAYYTKINGNLYGDGQSLTDAELTIIPEEAFLINQNIRYPKCIVDDYENVHTLFESGTYGTHTAKSVYYKKLSSPPLLRVECPDGSIIFVEMTGSGMEWEGTFTPPVEGTYSVRISASDSFGNTGVDNYELEYADLAAPENVLITISDGNVLLSWDASILATDYRIEYSTDPYGEFIELTSTTGGITSYLHIDGAVEADYFYRIIALRE
ncbi:MAG: fibronectin type III domain-containing protein [Pirellulales bacterium]|nr:fibronectin type III domain-containing protein [Pirellulales bacterium]